VKIDAKLIWLTGLPCSGKSTLARDIALSLGVQNKEVHILDGDQWRRGVLASDLGFSPEDRRMNLLRVAYVADMMLRHNIWVVAAFVSPERAIRDKIREMFVPGQFVEVFVDAPADRCAERDVKGMWAEAKAGKIKGFTGYDAKYEWPPKPEVWVRTDLHTEEYCLDQVMDYLNGL
jgi:adenylyl-sulfate kinase